jgi:hypothetical protein
LGKWQYGSISETRLTAILRIPVLLVLLYHSGYAATTDARDFQQLIMQAETIPLLLEKKVLTKHQIPNPHWHKDACLACHVDEPDEKGSPLKAESDGTCFFCHSEKDHAPIHPVNLVPGKEMLARMPDKFRRNLSSNNETNCITCHDALLPSTRKMTVASLHNRSFLRGGIYRSKTGICYRCHDKSAYQKLNPHDQINTEGFLEKNKCLICHREVPQQQEAGKASKVALHTDSNWVELCLNCHEWKPHPGGNRTFFGGGKIPDHLVVPGKKIRQRMDMMTRKHNLDLPLDPSNGKIYCATCHNPHERGVIKKASLAKGADEKGRLRSKKICLNCHDQ